MPGRDPAAFDQLAAGGALRRQSEVEQVAQCRAQRSGGASNRYRHGAGVG